MFGFGENGEKVKENKKEIMSNVNKLKSMEVVSTYRPRKVDITESGRVKVESTVEKG